ncbi:IS30 family transposase [Gilliamella sp. GillExp13]|uniref:IS30 family transposase n=1 Tax=Gilliamella sp. GillExp13 TaxID=3120243 RepID=UPI0021004FF7|nr:IS30 family transposase [Gilliamella apicola]
MEHYLNTTVYFAEPYKSWQRGSNENTNGLIRQFIPKPAAISLVDDEQIKKIQYLLNSCPRKWHKFKSPTSFYSKELRQIALHGGI